MGQVRPESILVSTHPQKRTRGSHDPPPQSLQGSPTGISSSLPRLALITTEEDEATIECPLETVPALRHLKKMSCWLQAARRQPIQPSPARHQNPAEGEHLAGPRR